VTSAGTAEALSATPLFAGLAPAATAAVVSCSEPFSAAAGDELAHDGDEAGEFFVLLRGRIALQLHAGNRGDLVIETLGPYEVVGWSWLFAPHAWRFDVVALDDVEGVRVDGKRLRARMEADHELGFAVLRRFADVVVDRLQHARLRLLDVYGDPG
jgi:CRP-like cAMP-binding protein